MTWHILPYASSPQIPQKRGTLHPVHGVTDPSRSTMTWLDSFNPEGLGTYRAEVARARRGVQTQQQPRDGDHVVLHERLGGDIGAGRRRKGLLGYSLGDAESPGSIAGSVGLSPGRAACPTC